jgi:hypothetical protein
MEHIKQTNPQATRLTVSLKTLSGLLDAHRSSVRRWLKEAGIKPLAIGRGKNGAIRYRWTDIESWLNSQNYID